MVEKLDSKIKEAVDLSRRLKEVDKQITLDPQYIKKTTNLGDSEQMGMGMGIGMGVGSREDMEMKRAIEMSMH